MAAAAAVNPAMSMMGGGGMNQMLELFKMQYLMKFLDGGGQGKGGASLFTMAALMGYDQLIKYLPFIISAVWLWLQTRVHGPQDKKSPSMLMLPTQTPPAQKQIRAYIQFERNQEKATDPRIDAVMYHVCNLPEVRSLRYNGVEMIPNFKDTLMIDNDVWFEIINPSAGGGITVPTSSKEARIEPILYRLSTYDHDITWLHKFVEETMDRYEQEKKNKLGSETYYFDQMTATGAYTNPSPRNSILFSKSKFTSNRTLKNVYLRQIGELQERVEFFMRRRDWYDSKGIPHTLGVVMYGVPGCGKTSTIKGIANDTKRHIFNIALSEIKTKDALKDLFYNEQVTVLLADGKREVLTIPIKQRLYVIEDIDAMNSIVIKRSQDQVKAEQERKVRVEAEMELLKQTQGEAVARNMMRGKTDDDTDKLDLATLLNVLDGVRETPGRIIILSTNYPERLDEALLRPGRFDMMLEFEKHSPEVLRQHLEKHYDKMFTESQWIRINRPILHKKWTPAEVSQILFRRVMDMDAAIDDLVNETPEKLFKFSQMKSTAEPAAEEQEKEPVKQEETQEEPPQPSTSLIDLFQQEAESPPPLESDSSSEDRPPSPPPQEAEPKKKRFLQAGELIGINTVGIALRRPFESGVPQNEYVVEAAPKPRGPPQEPNKDDNDDNDEDDWDIGFGFSGGGIWLRPDRPTQEQQDAEKAARAVLFAQEERALEEGKRRAAAVYERLEKLKESMKPVSAEGNGLWKEYSPEDQRQINLVQAEAQRIKEHALMENMLRSPMFTNEDGFTAMNENDICKDFAMCGSEEAQSSTEELDALFPPPLQEFSF